MIRTVIKLSNEMVMAFDRAGEQLPEYQGYYQEKRWDIIGDASPGTVFAHWYGSADEPATITWYEW